MTKQEFDSKYGGEYTAHHCDTEEKAKAFLSLAKSVGYTWIGNSDLEKTDNMWDVHKENTVYSIYLGGYVLYSSVSLAKRNGYKVVEFELDEPKEPFKVGDVVYAKSNGVELKITAKNLYRAETKDGTSWYIPEELLTHKKTLTKITKEQLAEMGYEVKE